MPTRNDQRVQAERAKLALTGGIPSDHFALLGAYNGYTAARARGQHWNFCRQMFLNPSTLQVVLEVHHAQTRVNGQQQSLTIAIAPQHCLCLFVCVCVTHHRCASRSCLS